MLVDDSGLFLRFLASDQPPGSAPIQPDFDPSSPHCRGDRGSKLGAGASRPPRPGPRSNRVRRYGVDGRKLEVRSADRHLDAPARQGLRQVQALPILEKMQASLQEQRAGALPKSPLGTAIGYALRNWVALTRYAEDGRLKIDNNGAEQALRPIVLGRKNWLFAGSEAAAHRTAILCSLVQTCKHLQINPFVYLRDVIRRVSTHPARLVLELTPREWKRLRQVSSAEAAA
jgi:Transposase IS66 family/IS66 C-terminal element